MRTEACCVDAAVSVFPYAFSGRCGSTPPGTDSAAAALPVAAWSPTHSAMLYRVDRWGSPYFTVNSNGNISVRPHGVNTSAHQEIDLLKVVRKASGDKNSGGLGLQLPLVVRFPDVLKNRLEALQSSFDLAIQSQGYEAHYQGVYPVKCNQDKFVVEDIASFGFGLEAGSKPELLLAMSCLCDGSPEALLICNGFKDFEYISLALLARKLHLDTVIVLEQEEELEIVINASKKLGLRPVIGVRAKLRTKHSGHFGSTSGEKGKFGLTTTQILRVVKKLQQHEMLDCLQLLHFHIGSQIPTVSLLADGVGEAAQIYCELVRFGASMRVIDVGGGLGIDYDGSKSGNSDLSVSYNLQEYASAVVEAIRSVCDRKSVKHPVICSESGRAIVSHHSILVFEAVSSSPHGSPPAMSSLGIQHFLNHLSGDALEDYHSLSAAASRGEYDACLLHTEQLKQRCIEQFKAGSSTMDQLAAVDCLCEFVLKAIGFSDSIRTYHINLSIFTSIPDFWGIDQLFPIIPIHRLDERPAVRGILSDLTCDSDGKIDRFIGGETSLPLHELDHNGDHSPYYLAMFLGGAYEEALGGFHNLFGGPSIVRVIQSDGPHGFAVTGAVPGPSCADVLRVMQHQPELMFQTLKRRIEELGDDGNGISAVELINGLAYTFNSMPYLAVPSSCSQTAAAAQYYNGSKDNECYPSAGDSVAAEEEQWSYCVA